MTTHKICLVAVDIRSAHNVGSLFRSCDAFGAELLLVGITPYPKKSNDDRLPHIVKRAEKEISKTALGAERSVRWRHASTFDDAISMLQQDSYTICAIEQCESAQSLEALRVNYNIALIVGREVEGLSPAELQRCDEVYEISMQGKKESLNVAVAAGIALYQASHGMMS